jgi:hypothetical protein
VNPKLSAFKSKTFKSKAVKSKAVKSKPNSGVAALGFEINGWSGRPSAGLTMAAAKREASKLLLQGYREKAIALNYGLACGGG